MMIVDVPEPVNLAGTTSPDNAVVIPAGAEPELMTLSTATSPAAVRNETELDV
jgi:hypothetical protein